MSSSEYSKFLIAGATGRTGIELVNKLIKQDKKVHIIVRNKTTAKQIFRENYEKIEKIIEVELGKDISNKEYLNDKDLRDSIEWCDVLVSAIGSTIGVDPHKADYTTTSDLISLCENSKNNFMGKIFVLITSLFITRPYSIPALILNYLIPNVLGWKALAENRLRHSDLNYLILRPGQLTGSNLNSTKKSIGVYQGDKVKGKISRENVALVIIEGLSKPWINRGRTTIDIVETEGTLGKLVPFDTVIPDNEKAIITADHFNANKYFNVCLHTIIFLLIIFIICKLK
jgi:nucleoside-diphosphate-sugar epimerase